MTDYQPITGTWDVLAQDRRAHGEWIHEYDFAPGEWQICFEPGGRHIEIFHFAGVPGKTHFGEWTIDGHGIIWVSPCEIPHEFARPAIFHEGYLYLFDKLFDDTPPAPPAPPTPPAPPAPPVTPARDAVIAHHAFMRWRLSAF